MALGTILVCLTTQEHAATLMKLAAGLARKHMAHLIGLHTLEALLVYPGIAMHVPEPAFAEFNASQRAEAEAIERIFDRYTRNEDFPSEWRLLKAESVSATDRMIESARTADLVIMAHEDPDADRFDQRRAQAAVIRESGRPVIVVPRDYDGPPVGANILLGWSNTRETARAAHDLIPLADPGASVTVLRITDGVSDEMRYYEALDLAAMFDRHGLKPALQHRERGGDDIAALLGQFAFETGADLIVTGAFGHSRAFDFVLGATSYALLRDAKLPVLFSR
ncbi:universal stress protein [Aestuariicoccus sp. MJ-SS9]|uniref:universal stress protein n=1 Tax=Aestuariicoccus sp. MJ-SS9 TaxID=3079855 RepID=UPI00290A7BD7|nr:universal stress protein [Aestuariicoccus sp. MJ-SS9]MDU8912455.1 universal stress protein [Aestuariicoccus sp. MJ-SS9]